MPTALIAEDEPLLAAELAEELQRLWPELELLPAVHDGHAALRLIEQRRPQLLFLDVQMPGLDGVQLARLAAGRAHVVFLTAFAQYAVQAFDEGAVDYLLKPLDRARLARAVLRIKERLARAPAEVEAAAPIRAEAAGRLAPESAGAGEAGPLRWITVQQGRELKLITVDEVCYFRADHKYVSVVTAESEALISTPLKELLARLDPELFWQVHRGTIINVHAVRSVSRPAMGNGLTLHLKNRPEKLQVSASYAHRFKQM